MGAYEDGAGVGRGVGAGTGRGVGAGATGRGVGRGTGWGVGPGHGPRRRAWLGRRSRVGGAARASHRSGPRGEGCPEQQRRGAHRACFLWGSRDAERALGCSHTE